MVIYNEIYGAELGDLLNYSKQLESNHCLI